MIRVSSTATTSAQRAHAAALHWVCCLVALLLFTLTFAAQAQTIITQSKALAGGVTPSDTPGFPITIGKSGSYVLTGNLSVPNGTSGIVITAGGVSIDLNGYRIQGGNACYGWGATIKCDVVPAPQVLDNGIEAAVGVTDVRVQNGSVRGFGASALRLNERSFLQQLTAGWTSGDAIKTGTDSMLVGVRAMQSAGNGIYINGGALVLDSQSDGHGLQGIVMAGLGASGGLIARSTAHSNGKTAMRTFSPYTNFVDNLANHNGGGLAGGVHSAGNLCDGAVC